MGNLLRKEILYFIIPILFFGIFLPRQAYLYFSDDFTVWKGGGMGMFSSYDSPSKRRVHVHLVDKKDGEVYRVKLLLQKRKIVDQVKKLKNLPIDKEFLGLVALLQSESLYVSDPVDGNIYISDILDQSTPSFFFHEKYIIKAALWKMKKPEFDSDNMANVSIYKHKEWVMSPSVYEKSN